MPHRFYTLIAAQFFSALADNALLIVGIAMLREMGQPIWWAPLLKLCFTLAYVVLAPVVGLVADAVPKAALMSWMNALKAVGVGAMVLGLDPLAAFALVGVAAACYAPAKYGLITEIVPASRLVAANGWIEVSVVCSVLLGTLAGGLLVSPWWMATAGGWGLRSPLVGSLLALVFIYAAAAGLQLRVPDSGAVYARAPRRPLAILRDFLASNATLWRDRLGGRLSLSMTTLFWGAGATLQLAVLQWAQDVLGLRLNQGAYLQATVAVGVVAGAGLAGRWIGLHHAVRVLPLGLMLGLLMLATPWVRSLGWALPAMVLVGAVGGAMVVPMNALLQHRGVQLLSAGRSIAVQGFNENLSILLMLGTYAALQAAGVPLVWLMSGLGTFVSLSVLLLMLRRWRHGPNCTLAAQPPCAGRAAMPES
ncbi:Major Facilitator Superfamily protein [Roseateles sp. YR242]|uniref:lysophospholipid transporter LplT n=1 Tax=Roseateles sp. YR242 TaxID=1855305 RepID=UPI0008D1F075|nr:lysophospholipid transporter LplT [Roseateles sp. YR242]SEK60084.1 Major Facilitator Superfamily protein [Roseateles sp. YR242]